MRARVRCATRGPDRRLRRCAADLNAGGSKFCGDCALKLPLKKDEAPTVRPVDAGPYPGRMYIECTAACNISCTQACCAPETGITRTRQAGMLDFELFKRVIDEVGPSLGRIDFFNYGEAFLHKRAVEMCEYIKCELPEHLPVHEHQRPCAVARSSPVASCTPGSTRSPSPSMAPTQAELRAVPAAREARRRLPQSPGDGRRKATNGTRPAVPQLALHPLQVERQRRGDGAGQEDWRRRSAIDRLCWEITDHPEDAFSRRFVPGRRSSRPSAARPGTTAISATRSRAPLRRRADSTCGRPSLVCPLIGARRRPLTVRARVRNLSARAFPNSGAQGRRLVRLGAQLCAQDGSLINLDFARADLPRPLGRRRQRGHRAEAEGAARTGTLPAEVRPGQRGG